MLEKLELNDSGIQDYLKNETADLILSKAEEIVSRCGDGFELSITYRDRFVAKIEAKSKEAMDEVYDNNILLKNLY